MGYPENIKIFYSTRMQNNNETPVDGAFIIIPAAFSSVSVQCGCGNDKFYGTLAVAP